MGEEGEEEPMEDDEGEEEARWETLLRLLGFRVSGKGFRVQSLGL